MKKPILAILLLLIWSCLMAFTPASTSWRDSGEFILSSFFLDIAHPAGFPVYSQISNIFALLPFGSIAWRVNLFSTFVVLLNLILTFVIARKLLTHEAGLGKTPSLILSLSACLILCLCRALFKQAYAAEVYALNCLFLQILIMLYYEYRINQDRRYLLLAAFAAGLSLGNHVSIGLIFLPILILILCDFQQIKKVILPAFILGLAGLSIYAYIPARAGANPPLNTGSPTSGARFLNLVSDARDRALRRPASASYAKMEASPLSSLAATAKNDLQKLKTEIPWGLLLLACLGLGALLRKNLRLGLVFAAVAFMNWLFFKGWPPDPWLPLLFCTAVLAAFAAGVLIQYLAGKTTSAQALPNTTASLFAAVLVIFCFNRLEIPTSADSPEWPAIMGRALVRAAPSGSAYLTEDSWFLLKYLQDVEGYRDDLALVYQGRVAHPDLFEPAVLINSRGETYDSLLVSHRGEPSIDDWLIGNMKLFIDYAARYNPLFFEPNQSINHYVSSVARLGAPGTASLQRGSPSAYDEGFSAALGARLKPLALWLQDGRGGSEREASHYLDAQITNHAELLSLTGQTGAAAALVETLCLPLSAGTCSIVPLNNLAVYCIKSEKYSQAADLTLKLLKQNRGYAIELKSNLRTAMLHLKPAQKQKLKEDAFAAAILKEMNL